MNNKKQKLLLGYIVSSADTFALCKSILKPDFFDPEFRKTVEYVHEYYDKYSAVPSSKQIEAETDVWLDSEPMTRDKIQSTAEEIAEFCQRKAFERAVVKAPSKIADGNYAEAIKEMQDALLISLNKDLGVSYFEGRRQRLEKALKEPGRTSTGWPQLDAVLSGGLARSEMILFSANSGGGKSITLANLAVNMLAQKLNVLYISLELSEELIEQRFDTMYTGVSSVVWKQKYRDIAQTVEQLAPEMGQLRIKRMPVGTCANDIRAYLKEYELKYGHVPDLLVVDYLDIMGPNEKVSVDNVFEKDKRAAEQLRDIGFDYNMFIATASQQNRSAIDAQELNHSHIAGGISKVNTVDWYLSIIMNPVMKAQGVIGFAMLKSRSSDGVGKQFYLKWDNNTLRILNPDKDDDAASLNEPEPSPKNQGPAKTLLDLLGDDD